MQRKQPQKRITRQASHSANHSTIYKVIEEGLSIRDWHVDYVNLHIRGIKSQNSKRQTSERLEAEEWSFALLFRQTMIIYTWVGFVRLFWGSLNFLPPPLSWQVGNIHISLGSNIHSIQSQTRHTRDETIVAICCFQVLMILIFGGRNFSPSESFFWGHKTQRASERKLFSPSSSYSSDPSPPFYN